MNVEAVTVDAYGTLVTLSDPVPALRSALAEHGIERDTKTVAHAFDQEVDYYVKRSHEGRDEATLALLRRDCAAVFLDTAEADLDPGAFTPAFIGALSFLPVEGAVEALQALADAGMKLAVVSNWDVGLHDHLRTLGLDSLVDTVVTSAEAGAPKPSPAIFELALDRLGTRADRAVHVGDGAADAEGALAAGVRFEPAPLRDAAARILA